MANKKNEKKISLRTYINWFLLMFAIVLVCFLAYKMYNNYQDNKLSESVLNRVVGTMQYDDIENATKELTSDDFIFISYVKSEEVRNLETRLKKIIVSKELQNNFYYLDATDLMLEDGYIGDLNKKLGLNELNKIEALPAILYYKDGKLVKVLSSTKDEMVSSDDFSNLLDSYEIIESK